MAISATVRRSVVEALQTEMAEGQVRGLLKALDVLPEPEAAEPTPQATVTTFGTVKQGTDPGELSGGATLGDVITAYNNLLISLRTATVIQEAF